MADLARVQAHVEQVEYLKELARRVAREIVGASLDLQAAITDTRYVERLLDRLLEELAGFGVLTDSERDANGFAGVVGFAPLPISELRRILLRTLTAIRGQAKALIEADLSKVAERADAMAASGVGAAVIAVSLRTEGLAAGVQATLAAVAAGAVAETQRAVLREARQGWARRALLLQGGQGKHAPPPLPDFRWVTMEDDRVCEAVIENSCRPRHARVLTEDEWKFIGEPGAFNLICSYYSKGPFSNCRCFLEPAEFKATSDLPINVGEAIAAGKKRAYEVPFPEAA